MKTFQNIALNIALIGFVFLIASQSKTLLLVVLIASAVVAVGYLDAAQKVASLRARGIYPHKGLETEADVLRLLNLGHEVCAVRCYRSLHKQVRLREAVERVRAFKSAQA
ncbi:MAG: hypothetical protein WCL04_03150 [Verrucomicrobiota bacterium]